MLFKPFNSKKTLENIKSSAASPLWQNWASIIFASIFMVIATLFWLAPTIKQEENNALRLQNAVAVQGRDLIGLYVDFTARDLALLGRQLLLNIQESEPLAEAFFEQNSSFQTFALIDTAGNPLVSGTREGGISHMQSSVPYKETEFFVKALKGERYVSPVYFGPKGPQLRIAMPVMHNGKILSVIAGEIDLDPLRTIVQTPFIPDGKLYLVDSAGAIITDQDSVRAQSGENLSYRDIVKRLLSGEREIFANRYINEKGISVIATGLRLPKTGWAVIVEQQESTAFKQRDETALIAFAFALAALILVCMLALGTVRLTNALTTVQRDRSIIESEKNKLELVLSGVTDAVIAVDMERRIIACNTVAEALLGVPAATVLGKYIGTTLKMFEDKREVPVVEYCPLNIATKKQEVFSKKNLKLTGAGEITTFVDVVAGEVPGGEHVNVGCILTLHNVTKETLFEKLKGDFVTVAAHQLRTPLSAIKWTLNMLLAGDLGELNAEQKSYVAKSFESNNRLIALVNDMLDVDRLESGMTEFHMLPEHVDGVIEKAAEEVAHSAKLKSILIDFGKFDKDAPKARIDAEKIKVVLLNLLDNAIKYTPTHGHITIDLVTERDSIVVSVADSGIGIPVDQQKDMFKKFFRGRNAVRVETEGTGLGLFLAKKIIEKHDGTMWLESKENAGTTFYFKLPVYDDAALQ